MKSNRIVLSLLAGLFCSVSLAFAFYGGWPPLKSQTEADLLPPPDSTYEQLWKAVDSVSNEGLPATALSQSERILNKAVAEGNEPQRIKSLLYIFTFTSSISDEAVEVIIKRIDQELPRTRGVGRSILLVTKADYLLNYYRMHQWELNELTALAPDSAADFTKWGENEFVKEAMKLIGESLQNETELKATPALNWKEIMVNEEGNTRYFPTLFDFLSHKAIERLTTLDGELIAPANSYQIDPAEALAPSSQFVNAALATRDSLSVTWQVLKLYQRLEQFHLSDSDPAARIHTQIERLTFVRTHGPRAGAESNWVKAMENLIQTNQNHAASVEAISQLAQYLHSDGDVWRDTESSDRLDHNKKALQLCETAIQKWPQDSFINKCINIKSRILQRYLQLNTLEQVAPGIAFPVNITWRNSKNIYLRLVRFDEKSYQSLMGASIKEEKKWELVRAMAALREWKVSPATPEDYNRHRTDVPVAGLPPGHYGLVVSLAPGFHQDSAPTVIEPFWVSDLSLMWRAMDQAGQEKNKEFYVTNFTTGQPVKKARINLYEGFDAPYFSRQRRISSLMTDENGRAVFSPDEVTFNGYSIEVIYGKDRLARDNDFYSPWEKEDYRFHQGTTFMLDRQMYRPGQTLYFKGIVTRVLEESVKPVVNLKQTVRLRDANGQEVATAEVKTNEFGSYQGSFTIPTGRLTGYWTIADDHGSSGFQVEEYRRPKFEVKMDPVKGSYKPNEMVKVTGAAAAYSGAGMEGNVVKYRVVRVAYYPYWCWEWGRMPSFGEEMEIAHGETLTEASGKFSVEFKAIPDLALDPATQPTFNYQVKVDVTDGTGETQSGQTTVAVSYVALNLSADLSGELEREKTTFFRVSTTNTNGQFIPAKGTAQVWRLKGPALPLSELSLPKSDVHLLTEAEWRTQFPTIAWGDDNNPQNWPKAESVLNANFDTEKTDSVPLSGINNWQEGIYLIEVKANDAFGTPVRYLQTFQIYSLKTNVAPAYSALWIKGTQTEVERGGTFEFWIASPFPRAKVLVTIATENKVFKREWVSLKGSKQSIKVPADLPPGHTYHVNVIMCMNGGFSTERLDLQVKRLPDHLDIEVETFRDKVEPGSQETWSLRIKGPAGEKVAAELVATLYDQSLDALGGSNYWSLMNRVQFYYSMPSWNLTYTRLVDHNVEGDPVRKPFLDEYQLRMWQMIGTLHEMSWFFADGENYEADFADFGNDEFGYDQEEFVVRDGNGSVAANAVPSTPSATGLKMMEGKESGGQGQSKHGGSGVRTNLKETAFFFPQLLTDEQGAIVLRFTMPEALTRWKFMALAHTTDMKVGSVEKTTVTQKDLMIQPFMPRFLREGDKVVLTAKVSNLTDGIMNGEATLELFDAFSMAPVNATYANQNNSRNFTVQKAGSETVKWEITVPPGAQALVYRVKARSGKFTDGEENTLPVLTNRMLVTEALPMAVRAGQTKTFTFAKLINPGSTTLRHERLTLEFTSNPAWHAVQALPYLMEYPYECYEQTFSRYYANALAAHIANAHPRIKQVFDQWAAAGSSSSALLSNLEKNQELKSLLLEETPWVLASQDESERKKRLALLFDLNRMASESDKALKKLSENQKSNGAWSWFAGGPDDRYITQHIATGLGKLQHLGVDLANNPKAVQVAFNSVKFLDEAIVKDYQELKRLNVNLKEDHLGSMQIHYLYMRSFYDSTYQMAEATKEPWEYYAGQARQFWLRHSKMEQAMIALALHRTGDKVTPAAILRSLKEFSMKSDELGVFWKENVGGYYWWQAPIEFQAMMIEAFDEAGSDAAFVEEMKLWLLKSKQTTDWKTTRATVEACYALLLRGTDFLAQTQIASITIGGQVVNPEVAGGPEVGTGYFKTSWSASDISPEMGKVTITNPNKVVSWGALYWQYFEQLDKITPAATPLRIEKKLYLKRNTDAGPVLEPITQQTSLKPGDRIAVRLLITTDRDLEYVHLKDLRASGLEPVNVLSQYKWEHGLGFYQATRDAGTHFFISWLPRGAHPFEYELVVSHTGDFSNGITTVQCMYAPEFTAHSEGIRLTVKE